MIVPLSQAKSHELIQHWKGFTGSRTSLYAHEAWKIREIPNSTRTRLARSKQRPDCRRRTIFVIWRRRIAQIILYPIKCVRAWRYACGEHEWRAFRNRVRGQRKDGRNNKW